MKENTSEIVAEKISEKICGGEMNKKVGEK